MASCIYHRLGRAARDLGLAKARRDEKPGNGCLITASVPMARGKRLFPFRTQKLSLAAVTILREYPWENSTAPFYALEPPEKVAFRFNERTEIGSLIARVRGAPLTPAALS
jgi:hypothetical protein